jgi:hypothetical protein
MKRAWQTLDKMFLIAVVALIVAIIVVVRYSA